MRYVFGPVPSRRAGRSLGIDPVPLKTCNWNCVYCQLGRTSPLIHARREWHPREEILAEVEAALAAHPSDEIDWVTFVASGETTLHRGLGRMIERVKRLTEHPVAVITNGSLLYLSRVREELAPSDAVLPSLDAGGATLYRKINRPHPRSTYQRLVQGLIDFRGAYTGKLWVEVMLVQGLNDDEPNLRAIAAVLESVRPDEVHINSPIRPPAEAWVRPPDPEGLMRAGSILGQSARVIQPTEGAFEVGENDDIIEAVLAVITRHPMRQAELEDSLGARICGHDRGAGYIEIQPALSKLEASGRARRVVRHGTLFWVAAESRFAEAEPGAARRADGGQGLQRQTRL